MERSGEDELRARQACGEGRRCPGWLVGEDERTRRRRVAGWRRGAGGDGVRSPDPIWIAEEGGERAEWASCGRGGSERVGLGFRASRGEVEAAVGPAS